MKRNLTVFHLDVIPLKYIYSIFFTDDDACEAAWGYCKWTDDGVGCANGKFVRGKCAGPQNRQCCIRKDDSLCDAADGDCEWKDDGCSGEWSGGKCAGPADRVCCVGADGKGGM